MKLFIKNMVSLRCKMAVRAELEKLGIQPETVELGEVEIKGKISETQYTRLKENLMKYDLKIIKDKSEIIIERIKTVIIEMIHFLEELPNINYSVYISNKIGKDYTYLANIFSKVKGITIQQFIILHKIEKVKELLASDDFNLTEAAYKLNYSSVAHLSYQFKKITGLTPTNYKKMQVKNLLPLDEVEALQPTC